MKKSLIVFGLVLLIQAMVFAAEMGGEPTRSSGWFKSPEAGYKVFIPKNCKYLHSDNNVGSINIYLDAAAVIGGGLFDSNLSFGSKDWNTLKGELLKDPKSMIKKNVACGGCKVKDIVSIDQVLKNLNGMDCVLYRYSLTYLDGSKQVGYFGFFRTRKKVFKITFDFLDMPNNRSLMSRTIKIIKSVKPL